MSKTKHGRTRQPNRVKPPPQAQLGRDATTMKVVEEPVLGRFYAIDSIWWDDVQNTDICLFSGRREPRPDYYHGGGMWEEAEPVVLVEFPSGSMIYYLGKHYLSELRGEYHKIGYGEYFGYVQTSRVMFYDLGE